LDKAYKRKTDGAWAVLVNQCWTKGPVVAKQKYGKPTLAPKISNT
jgi:hypothetical protein